ncbi:MAG: TfoX/Sxy family protein [Acidiferrobacterales bacterium]|jgi:TfoX/Sxy family transcriptional regulator of competence genes|nr:TfoX/Sxy family protein [Acidiferrobacterales bacterium]
MAYDEGLSQRIRELLENESGVDEKRMFGGLAFMVHGNMSVGVTHSDLMVRVGPDDYDAALAEPHTRPMDFTGKPLRGFVYVDARGYESDEGLEKWVARGVHYALSLPPK